MLPVLPLVIFGSVGGYLFAKSEDAPPGTSAQENTDQLIFAAVYELRSVPGLDDEALYLSVQGREPSLELRELLAHLGVHGVSKRPPGGTLVAVTDVSHAGPERAQVRFSVQGDGFSGPLEYVLGRGPTGWMPIRGM